MPNYPMSWRIQEYLTTQVRVLSERPCAQVRNLFPLDAEEVQQLVLDEATCSELQSLVNRGVQTIHKPNELRVCFMGRSSESKLKIPELRRSTVVRVSSRRPAAWFVKYATNYGIHGEIRFDAAQDHYIVADISVLPEYRRIILIKWLEQALRQERIKEIAVEVAAKIIKQHAATSTHLQVLFPALCNIIEIDEKTGRHDREYLSKWKEKLRNPARSLYNYMPEPWVEATYKPLFPVVEAAVNAGRLIGKDVAPDMNKLQAKVEFWERLPGDVKFPLKRKELSSDSTMDAAAQG